MNAHDVLTEREALIEMLGSWSVSIGDGERRIAVESAALESRAQDETVSVGTILADAELRRALHREAARVRREREDLHAVVSTWTCRPWRASHQTQSRPPTERIPVA